MATQKTDEEIVAVLHAELRKQSATLRQLARHAPCPYLQDLIERASTLLEGANTAWIEEEQQAGRPLWR
jgi:hypothetical protein